MKTVKLSRLMYMGRTSDNVSYEIAWDKGCFSTYSTKTMDDKKHIIIGLGTPDNLIPLKVVHSREEALNNLEEMAKDSAKSIAELRKENFEYNESEVRYY